jgi:hypothetical protein
VKFTSQIQNAWLLKGLVRAGSISVVAQDTLRNGKRASTASTQFNSLRVNGQAMSNPVPNTRVDIPGLGYVVLNEQHIPAPTSRARTEVNGLHAYITLSNTLGLAIGTELILGHAASLAFPVPDSGAGS